MDLHLFSIAWWQIEFMRQLQVAPRIATWLIILSSSASLRYDDIGDEGCRHLAEAMKSNTSLTILK